MLRNLIKFFCAPLTSDKLQKSRPRKIENVAWVLLEKLQGSWRFSCSHNFVAFFPGHVNHCVTNFLRLWVTLAWQEHKLNFQQWSWTLLISYFEAISLILDRAMTYLSELLVLLWIGPRKTKDNVSGVHLSKLLTSRAKNLVVLAGFRWFYRWL